MLIPFQLLCNGDTKVFSATNTFNSLAFHLVGKVESVGLFPGDGQGVTFLDVELHAPCVSPLYQFVEILLEGDLVCSGFNFPVDNAVVCEEAHDGRW